MVISLAKTTEPSRSTCPLVNALSSIRVFVTSMTGILMNSSACFAVAGFRLIDHDHAFALTPHPFEKSRMCSHRVAEQENDHATSICNFADRRRHFSMFLQRKHAGSTMAMQTGVNCASDRLRQLPCLPAVALALRFSKPQTSGALASPRTSRAALIATSSDTTLPSTTCSAGCFASWRFFVNHSLPLLHALTSFRSSVAPTPRSSHRHVQPGQVIDGLFIQSFKGESYHSEDILTNNAVNDVAGEIDVLILSTAKRQQEPHARRVSSRHERHQASGI